MRSTIMDIPLTIASIMRYGTSVFGDREVVTCTADGSRRRTYAEAGRRAARLANALRRLGVDTDQRVGTYMWNNAEHLEAYLAVPSMGAVLHTLNIRLAAAEVGYVASHADDSAVIVDASLVSKFAEVLPQGARDQACDRVRSPARPDARRPTSSPGWPCTSTRNCWPPSPTRSTGPSWMSARRRRCATPAGPPGTPRASSTATGPATCTRWVPASGTPSPCPNATGCSRSCRCSTPTRGAWPTPACCPARP